MKQLPWISTIFWNWDSQTTWLGRNCYHNKLTIKSSNFSNWWILLIWSWALEPLEISKIAPHACEIIAVDYNDNVEQYYKTACEWKLIWSDIEEKFKNKIVGKKSIRADKSLILDTIHLQNIDHVTLIKKHIQLFFQENTKKFNILIAHNLINNLRFQKSYSSNESLLDFYKQSEKILEPNWLFSIVDNYEWFQHKVQKSFSTLELIRKSWFSILCHYPAYASLVLDWENSCINENNNIMIIRKKDNNYIDLDIKKFKVYYLCYLSEYDIKMYNCNIWTYTEFCKSINKRVTNLVLIKISRSQYLWINIEGTYLEIFNILAEKWFYPKEIWHFLKQQ